MTRIASFLLVLLGACALTFGIAELRADRGSTTGSGAVDPSMGLAIPPPAIATAPPTMPRPSDALHDPAADPFAAIDDAREARKYGWALVAVVVLILVSRGLGTARKRWPTSRALSWMSGRVGLVVIGGGVVGAAAFDAILLGGSWYAAGYAAIGAALALIDPDLAGKSRQPERGSATPQLLVILAGAGFTVAAMGAWSCAGTRQAARVIADTVTECAKLTASQRVDEYADRVGAALLAGTAPNGEVSWAPAKREIASILADAGLEVAGCAAAKAVARILYPTADAPRGIVAGPEPSAASLRDGWETTREEMFGERRFEVEIGKL